MSSVIATLLATSGAPIARRGIDWKRVLLVNNVGAIPNNAVAGEVEENRGFNLVFLDASGSPELFCKCRPANSGFRERSSIAARLSRIPALSELMPRSWAVHTQVVDAEVTRYVDGPLLEQYLPAMTTEEVIATLNVVIDAAATISQHAACVGSDLPVREPEISLADASAWMEGTLREAGLTASAWSTLFGALERGGRVPGALQHGDLWPRNVIAAAGRWQILDFEQYGSVQVPLYDALHLVRTAWDARTTHRKPGRAWLDELVGGSAEGAAYRVVLRNAAEHAGVTPRQAAGALVYYVVDVLARMQRRRALPPYATPFLVEAERLAEFIAKAGRVEDVFCADAPSPSRPLAHAAPTDFLDGHQARA